MPTARRAPVLLAAIALAAASVVPTFAAAPGTTLVPIGAGYSETTLEQFAGEAAAQDDSGTVSILVLPITFATDAFRISNGERQKNLTLAGTRRGQIEAACQAVIPAGESCSVVLAPILTRDDATAPGADDFVTPGLDGIYILGGDQTIAIQVVADTDLEDALTAAHAAGAVVGGNSAGAAVESQNMIAGYTGANGPEQGFEAGAVDLWTFEGPSDLQRGLVLGLPDTILDQHVLQRGRIARLINVSMTSGLLGIGVDADTAATIQDETTLTELGGATAAFVADDDTYDATIDFDASGTASIRSLATHVLAPGDGYDLVGRLPVVGGSPLAAPSIAGRAYPSLAVPVGAGSLILGGGVAPSSAAVTRLVEAAGGAGSNVVVVAAGYAKDETATKDAKAFAAAVAAAGATSSWFVVGKATPSMVGHALETADGVLLTAPDPSTVMAALNAAPLETGAIHGAWANGAALLANDAAASAVGSAFTSDPRPGPSTGAIESAAMEEFIAASTTISAGLGWVDLAVEPGIVSNRHWGRLYSLVAASGAPAGDHFAVGIDAGTAVELGAGAPTVLGDSVAVVLDGRVGTFGVGSNGAIAARWVVLDAFVAGDSLAP
jgi:cyanophycinase